MNPSTHQNVHRHLAFVKGSEYRFNALLRMYRWCSQHYCRSVCKHGFVGMETSSKEVLDNFAGSLSVNMKQLRFLMCHMKTLHLLEKVRNLLFVHILATTSPQRSDMRSELFLQLTSSVARYKDRWGHRNLISLIALFFDYDCSYWCRTRFWR